MPTIKCPNCGNVGGTGSDAFQVRGTWQGKPVRKCSTCGSGMTVGFPKRVKLLEPELWARMEASWERGFGVDNQETVVDSQESVSDSEYPVARCPYCGNTGSIEPGSSAFEYRVKLGEPKVRMCRSCRRGFWVHSETGQTEPMSDESWAGIEMLHESLGGGAHVDAEWTRRAAEEAQYLDDDVATPESLLERTQLHASYDEPLSIQEEDGTPLRFRIIRVDDPINPTDDEFGADPGNRYVAVEVEVVNESQAAAGSPLSVALVDDLGHVHDAALATHQPEFDPCPYLEPQERQTGFVLFELAEQALPVQFALGFDDATSVGLWALEQPRRQSAPKLDSNTTDPIEQIRRLGELRDEGLLTDDEFELKKNELLGRL